MTASVAAADRQDYDAALASWSRTLEQFVDEQGRTDFEKLADNPAGLRNFVQFIEKTSPASQPELFTSPAEILAYHINAYNALAMFGVISEGIPSDFDSFFKRWRFFKLRSVVIGGEETSLQDYENNIIRPLGEPRIHFVLNCMVRDCPRLPMQPFFAETLEQQLAHATLAFFNTHKHLRLDADKRTLYLSKILDFYTEDFVPSDKVNDLISYVNRYSKIRVPEDYLVEFMDYDWTINQQPQRLPETSFDPLDEIN